MLRPSSTLKLVRQLHLYLGVFITPALLFFAFTGALQSLNLHETQTGSSYKPASWIVHLAQLHKKQTTIVPARKPRPEEFVKAGSDKAARPSDPNLKSSASPAIPRHLPMKFFFVLVSLGLAISSLSGLYMSYKYTRRKLVIAGLLLAGIVVPLLLLPF